MAKRRGNHSSGNPAPAGRVVLGKYPDQIQVALDAGGVFYDPTEQVLRRLEQAGIDPWRMNEAFLRQQEAEGLRFDTTLQGLTPDDVTALIEALAPLATGNVAEAQRILKADRLPSYAQEAQWLMQNGYIARVDKAGGWIHWDKP